MDRKGSLKRKGREGMSLQKFLGKAKYLESRSWVQSRARVEGLVLDSRRSPSFAERGAGEVPESP